ncbi:MAG: polymer-forming cytoskeletal protein [Enterococcus sp.]
MLSKKFMSFATIALLSLTLGACSSDDSSSDSSSSSEAASSEVAESSEAEVVSTASVSADPETLTTALGEDGNWIIAATEDVTFEDNVTVAGEFHDKGDDSADIYRKFALYAQDEDRNVTAEYTATVPELDVQSENFNIVHGTVDGDILVEANGFVLDGVTVTGNVTFASQEYQDSATIDGEDTTIEGEVTVAE